MASIETYDNITIDRLTKDSVSILRKTMVDLNGQPTQVGDNFRRAYTNSIKGREYLSSDLSEPYLSAVMTVWGDTPTVEDPE